MIKYNDILCGIGDCLKDNFPEIDRRVKKNKQDLTKPSFYVQVRPLETVDYKRYRDKLINISVCYINVVEDRYKLIEILEQLESALDLGIKVNGTFLLFKNKRHVLSDDDMNFTINLTINYKDDRTVIDESDYYSALMEELYVDFKTK
ncbi:MAG: hypothetical protein E6240_01750 [Clostridium butyricum]|nr:hypothetical protein [Clostridium butyricum]